MNCDNSLYMHKVMFFSHFKTSLNIDSLLASISTNFMIAIRAILFQLINFEICRLCHFDNNTEAAIAPIKAKNISDCVSHSYP